MEQKRALRPHFTGLVLIAMLFLGNIAIWHSQLLSGSLIALITIWSVYVLSQVLLIDHNINQFLKANQATGEPQEIARVWYNRSQTFPTSYTLVGENDFTRLGNNYREHYNIAFYIYEDVDQHLFMVQSFLSKRWFLYHQVF